MIRFMGFFYKKNILPNLHKKYSSCCHDKIDLIKLPGDNYEQMICVKCKNPAKPERTEAQRQEALKSG